MKNMIHGIVTITMLLTLFVVPLNIQAKAPGTASTNALVTNCPSCGGILRKLSESEFDGVAFNKPCAHHKKGFDAYIRYQVKMTAVCDSCGRTNVSYSYRDRFVRCLGN